MFRNKKITVYFPARNESGHIDKIIKSVPSFVDEIIMVSNRSYDTTIEEGFCNKKLKLIIDDRSIDGIGYGFAHMTAMEYSTGDILVAADADLTYPLDILKEILSYCLDNHLDFLNCTRYPVDKKTKISRKLQLGVNILNQEVRLLYGIKISDILSGMWVFKKDIVDKLHLRMGDWNLSPEIKIKAFLHDAVRYGEYHISQKIRAGETKQDYLATGWSHFRWILANRFGLGNPKKMDIIYSNIKSPISREIIHEMTGDNYVQSCAILRKTLEGKNKK
jgi:glycosyltransferase involved in cell wall biosynthesis